MGFYNKYLAEQLKDPDFKRIWEELGEEYEEIRDAIILKRLENLEKNPETAIPWKDIKKD